MNAFAGRRSPGVAKNLKRLHFPVDVILLCVRWYVAYSLSLRDLEEMIAEHGIEVDHSTVHRWVIKLVPLFKKAFRKHRWARAGGWTRVCHEHKRKFVVLYEDGIRPPGAGLQEQASNRPVLLRSKGVVVSDRGKVIHKDGRYVLRR